MSFLVKKAYAQLSADDFGADFHVGAIYNFYNVFVFIFNLFFWLGGTLIFISIIWSIANMAINAAKPDVEAMKAFSGGAKQILMTGFAGVLMMSFSLVFDFVGNSLGADISPRLPVELDFIFWN